MNNKKYIWVTFQREGVHFYPESAIDPHLKDVSFLQYPHRHMFHFKVKLEVTHANRDVEFILLKRELESLFGDGGVLQLDYKSCEMIADDLAKYIRENYPDRDIIIDVSEDNENGCTCHYPK